MTDLLNLSDPGNVTWLHSNGPDNKDPLYDLGGQPSQFQLSAAPANNLFDNLTPAEANVGRLDWRCFYIVNNIQNQAVLNVSLQMTVAGLCTTTTFGTKQQDDEQLVSLVGTPSASGYAIFQTEFGPPFTVYYNTFNSFGTDFQTKLNEIPFCQDCTVSTALLPDNTGAQYTVTFTGCAGKRNVQLITLVQNDLVNLPGNEYRTAIASVIDDANSKGDTKIKVTRNIDLGIPVTGIVHVVNITDNIGEYLHLPYSSFSGQFFNLITPLPINLNTSDSEPPIVQTGGDEVWVDGVITFIYSSSSSNSITVTSTITDVPSAGDLLLYNAITNNYTSIPYVSYSEDTFTITGSVTFTPAATIYVVIPYPQSVCLIDIVKIQDGWPINQYANIIENETTEPDYTDQTALTTLDLGFLRPLEGFFVWTKRRCAPLTVPCSDKMTYVLTGEAVNWPVATS